MRAIDLALKDLTQLVRDGKTALFLLALPIVFTLMFGFAFGGLGSQDARLPVGYLDRDAAGGGPLGERLLDLLKASTVIRPMSLKEADAERIARKLRDAELAAAVIVPAGYGDALLAGAPLPLEVVGRADVAGQAAQDAVRAAAARLAGAAEAALLTAQLYEQQAGLLAGGGVGATPRDRPWVQAIDAALAAWQAPSLTVDVRPGAATKPAATQTGFSHTSPSMMVQFAIAGLIGAASLLVQERKARALRRLLTTAISRGEIIFGHYLAMVALILTQLAVLVAFGQLLRVDYMRQPLATLLVMGATALWTASLGLLIGTLAKTEEQVILFSLLPMFVLAGLGGAWVPLESAGKTFAAIGHLLPTAWAMDGFENIVIRGLGLGSVLLPVGVMLAYALALFALAAWRFRFE